MTTFTLDDRTYRVRPFDADVHVSLLFRLMPLFSALVSVAPDVLAARQRQDDPDQAPDPVAMLAEIGAAVGPVAEKLANLDRQGDAKIVMDECLKATDQQAEGWHPVMTRSGIISNHLNKGYAAKLKITVNAVRINFGPTMQGMGLDIEALMGGTPDAGV